MDDRLLPGLALHAVDRLPGGRVEEGGQLRTRRDGNTLGPLEPAGGCTQVDDMEDGMAWSGTWGFLKLGRHAAGPAAAHLRDDHHRDRHHREHAAHPDADTRALLPQLGAALLLGAALVLGPALGLRLLATGHWGVSVANQSQRKASTRSRGPAHSSTPPPLARRNGPEGDGGLPQVAVDEGHGDRSPTLRVGELPGTGHPGLIDQRLALDGRAHDDIDALGTGGRERPRRTRRRGVPPIGRRSRRDPRAATGGARRSGPRHAGARPGRRTAAGSSRRA